MLWIYLEEQAVKSGQVWPMSLRYVRITQIRHLLQMSIVLLGIVEVACDDTVI